ncbi:cytochrome-c peroxidase [Flavobacterium turcicum]|uniref:Cytochrome-c peroxidase n=1 Tax=Flavobacterium turcicum TaxID=2764718 RepID=A0ABR7JEM5_9FLAO|nr:cytochrome c peroxidase [Flavobacterium turcicum]MBC5862966.1 cytochrome-c peroxidase [Flavobacterium turcicum]NHL01698.1 cytochrome-c peroxidase [Flavobacterium turcicum]
MKLLKHSLFIAASILAAGCSNNNDATDYIAIEAYPNIKASFEGKINLNQLDNYANQVVPAYITKDNTTNNPITDKGATLGRILFYDKNLSATNTVSCSSCHVQANAFGDVAQASTGVNGLTSRHSMRLINTRFSNESKFFWNERATNLENQTTQPIQDHIEMGFSGTLGDGNFNTLTSKLQNIGYYKELFKFVYGSEDITENKIQLALAQFIRSIQSFDAKYDIGRALVANENQPFPNFTVQENQGKNLFLTPPVFDSSGSRTAGGLGCAGCHQAPEFSIDPNSRNNGIIGILNSNGIDITNTRSPTLRDAIKKDGSSNGAFMHTANLATLQNVIGHYGTITIASGNTNLDPRLRPNGSGQKLNLTATEVDALIAFIKTLSGSNVYTDPKWANPFK